MKDLEPASLRDAAEVFMAPEITTERLSELRAMPYVEYLQTNEWRRRRDRALAFARWKCERSVCRSTRDLQVHHLTYDRLGAELDGDLVVFCGAHHRERHLDEMAKAESSSIYVKLAREAFRADPGSSIADIVESTKCLCAQHHVPYDGPNIHKAVGLLTGARVVQITPDILAFTNETVESQVIAAEMAAEILERLGIKTNVIKTLPDGFLPHLESVLEQARRMRSSIDKPRQTWADQLNDIFSSNDGESDSERIICERAEIDEAIRRWDITDYSVR